MKHTKKKRRRPRASSKPVGKVAGAANGFAEDDEAEVLNALMEAFSFASLDDAVSAHRQAKGDADKTAEILGALAENVESASTSSSSNLSQTSGSGSGTSSSSSSESTVHDIVNGKGLGRNKAKRVVAVTGTVSTVLGKEYMKASQRRDSPTKAKGFGNGAVAKEEAEQFLCSMLGDECKLNMAVVRDVLCYCGYDVEKALDALLDLSTSSYEQSMNGGYYNGDTQLHVEHCDKLTDRISDCTSQSSEGEFQENIWAMGNGCRNYASVLSSCGAQFPSSSRVTGSNIPQKVLESLFNISKSSEHEPNTMNWRNVVKKMESLGPGFDVCRSTLAPPQQDIYAKREEYQVFRKDAEQHWVTMRSYYQKAATAYSKGEQEYAAYLSEQGQTHTRMARVADEKASQYIFEARNKGIENVITIDLHGQHVKQAMRLLKIHLLFGAYVPSVQTLRVITGCGTHGVGKSKLKQSNTEKERLEAGFCYADTPSELHRFMQLNQVINLLEKEGIAWKEENRGTVLIRLDGQKEFSFLDSGSDSE